MTKQELDNLIIENIYTNDAGLITGLVLQQVLLYLADYSSNKDELMELFLSKLEDDTAQGLITFLKGIEVGDFTTGALGSGAAIKMVNGTSYAEVDHLTVRQKATFRELIIEALKHIGGQLVLTPARMKCVRVVDGGTYYKCYFDTGDGEVSNEFVEGDLARCQVFTGSGTKFYWRLVTLVGEDWINLSKTSAAVGSDVPEAGDDIVQLGNVTDTTRQSAIILSTVGIDAPSWKQYSGINSFSLEGKETTVFSKLGNRIQGKTVFTSGGANLDDHLDGVAQDILDALQAAQDAEDKAQQAIEDAEANVGLINAEVGKLQAQLDGEVSNWFYPYSPTLANYPASDWTTNEIKDRHIGDTFTNTQTFVDNATTPDAGKSWRFVKNGSTYSWTAIADSDAVKALLEASKAQATADGKSTTHLFQPTKYKLGDMWVLNADQTVNGTAYKQGEILTATQDSETFNQAHWLKRVRYTDDTAIDNLEIGGRNLITGSFNDWRSRTVIQYGYVSAAIPIQDDWRGKKVTHSFEVKDIPEGESVRIRIDFWRPDNTYITHTHGSVVSLSGKSYVTYTVTTDTQYSQIRMRIMPVSYTSNYSVLFRCEKLEFGTKATDWTPAPEDVQAEIDAAVVKATYWSVKASAPVIYKDAINAATSGTHTTVVVSGELRSGTTTTSGGFITVTPNGGTEAGTASASPVTIAPADSDGKTSYTVKLYDTASKTTLLDTMTIPVVFKGASGVNAISAVLSNEADVLPASSEGVVSDYSGSGTDIIVYEGGARLTYGTGNGQFQVSASGSGISVGSASTVSGNIRRYANASNMTSDNATITFTITGKTVSGISFSLTKVQAFAKSKTGQKGADGVSITLVDVEFAKNTNPTTAPTTGWTTTAPTLADGEQLWTRTKTTYSSGSPTYSTPANITPKTGAVGQGIDSVTEEFAISSSKTVQPTTGWSTTQPTWVQGQYIWSRVKVVYKNPASTVYTGYAVSSEWEAVNDLEIGGRNLLIRSTLNKDRYLDQLTGNLATWAGLYTTDFIEVVGGADYTFFAKKNAANNPYQSFRLAYYDINKTFLSGLIISQADEIYRIKTPINAAFIRFSNGGGSGYTRLIDGEFKVEKGTKATGWQLAPEDVEAEIDEVKLTAEQAQLAADGYMRARYIRDWLKGNTDHNSNNWSEIKVVNKAGVNLASGLPASNISANGTWHASYPKTNVIDGNTSTQGYIPNTSQTENYVQIDLGQIHYDIDYIQVWHAGWPTRMYYGTKTEISEDGVNWTTIFDSAVEGTYVETAEGKIHTQRYAKVIDKLAETSAKTKYQTNIDGGLIYTALMKLFSTLSGNETAFISGLQGAEKDLPAFGAGGSYQDAVAGTAKAIIRHDGSSKFTDTEITGVVNATSGTIGGFNIGSTYIGTGSSVGGSVNGMSLSNDFIVFNQSNRQALIGPVSDLGFDFLGRFRDTTSKPGYTKTGVIINISGGSKNNALDVTGDILLKGNMSLKGAIDGLAIRTRQISTTTYLTSEDVYVSCYNTTSITVYLPSSPVTGKVIFIRTVNTATVTVNGNGKTINWGTGTGASRGVGDGRGDTAMLVYDGQYWMYNYMIR